jgi:SSS family solute:Na+ symporter
VWALIANLVVSIVVSVLVRVIGLKRSDDHTRPEDYLDVVEG